MDKGKYNGVGSSANYSFNAKKNKYADKVSSGEFSFLPICFESTGLIHSETKSWFKTIAYKSGELRKIKGSIMYKFFLKTLSINLQRSIAKNINSRIASCNSNLDEDSSINIDYIDEHIHLDNHNSI